MPEQAEKSMLEFLGVLLEGEFVKSIGSVQVKFLAFLLAACQNFFKSGSCLGR